MFYAKKEKKKENFIVDRQTEGGMLHTTNRRITSSTSLTLPPKLLPVPCCLPHEQGVVMCVCVCVKR